MRGNGRAGRDSRDWASEAVRRIEADDNRSADTHLHAFPLPPAWGIDLYLKDESVHPTGSLKHRLARSLFLYGLCNGWIHEHTTVVDASSGSTAVSEAYFAWFLGLPFVAVMPASTSPEKIALIEAHGGSCHLVDDPTTVLPSVIWPLQSPYRKSDRASRCLRLPVGCVDSSLRYSCTPHSGGSG